MSLWIDPAEAEQLVDLVHAFVERGMCDHTSQFGGHCYCDGCELRHRAYAIPSYRRAIGWSEAGYRAVAEARESRRPPIYRKVPA